MRGNARYDGATVTQGKWQTDVEAYIATLAAHSAETIADPISE